ncbi:MAG TPA: 50S ribosomal protein L6 [Candidatus Goldiibacteriota bacterium]|nr:50S ribosomal protein L6 [Candidatus Goldiibacteriota bacterium]
MSRIGKMLIKIPEKVNVSIGDGTIKIEGPAGKAEHRMSKEFIYKLDNGIINVVMPEENAKIKKINELYGMERAILNGKIVGCKTAYTKTLILKGVGYRAALQGTTLNMTLGYSHPVNYKVPDGVKAVVDNQTKIILTSSDKYLLGQTAAEIRAFKKPEPYQGKGIMYETEIVRRKAGKSAATAGASGGGKK